MHTDPHKFIRDLQDQAAQHFESQVQLAPFYLGHHDAAKNAVAVADRMGRPVVWISTENMPLDIALGVGRMIAKLLNDEYDGLLKEFDNQTGKISAFREQLQAPHQLFSALLGNIIGAKGQGPSTEQGDSSNANNPNQ